VRLWGYNVWLRAPAVGYFHSSHHHHEKSYVGGCIQNYRPYLAFLFSLFCYPYISNAFPIACLYIIIWKIVNKQPSHLSGVKQWRQSPHDVEGAESSIAITVAIIQFSTVHSSQDWSEIIQIVFNRTHSVLK